jgi:hypothetical protein
MIPQPGDVLITKRLAIVERDISIVPHAPHLICPTHDEAVATGCALAEQRHTDAWLTEDRVHFLRLASYRISNTIDRT